MVSIYVNVIKISKKGQLLLHVGLDSVIHF